MAAAMSDLASQLTPEQRDHYERLELRAIDGELNRWGKWVEEHSDFDGFPRSNILESYIGGDGGGTAGHRILCDEMPLGVWATHQRVLLLPPELQDAVSAYYVVRMKPDGTLWTMAEKCLRLAVSERTLRDRLGQAKRRILGL